MKKFLLGLTLLFSIGLNAQEKDTTYFESFDSSTVKLDISLKAEQHYLIIDFLQDVKNPKIADYIKQVVKQTDSVYNPSKVITINAESSLVPDIYMLLTTQREGVTAQPNDDMKISLLPQIYLYTWIVKEIQRIDAANTSLRHQRTMRGFEYAKSLKW